MYNITKEQHDALPEFAKTQYSADGDKFSLTEKPKADPSMVSGADLQAAIASRDEVAAKHTASSAELADLKAKIAASADKNLRKKGDLESIDKSWGDKFATQEETHKKTVGGKDSFISKILVDNVAATIANAIAVDGSAELLLPLLKSRLNADFSEDVPFTRVLDVDGKPSVATIADLQKEFHTNEKFSAIMKGSKANGGGAGGAGDGAGGSIRSIEDFKGDATAETEFANKNTEQYKTMLEAHKESRRP